MAAEKIKLITTKEEHPRHTHQDNWEVMKPFVSFSFKALKVIAVALIAIVRALPSLKPEKNNKALKRR